MVGLVLWDRRRECAALDRLLEAVRDGESRALLLRGQPGVGKTALLEYLVARVPDWRIAQAAGVQSEMELPYAGLHQLCGSFLDGLNCLPGPQAAALRTVFGMSAGGPPDGLLVGLATLGLLAQAAAEDRPLLCVVDDTQWLDQSSVQTLAIVARRLRAESVALLFAAREPLEHSALAGIAELVVPGLPDDAARGLLVSALPERLDAQVIDRIVAEARGNPLALLHLPRGRTPSQLAGGFGAPDTAMLPARIEESFQRQLAPLGTDARQLLVIAAADPVGDPLLSWQAAARLGIDVAAVSPAQPSELVEFGTRVRFGHPLVRSAIYHSATAEQRRAAHQALADSTDPQTEPDRRAWHHAAATGGPNEAVAEELVRCAGRAAARGGVAAAAAFLERAATLTLDPPRRIERMLAAAQNKYQAGAYQAALELVAAAESKPFQQAQIVRARLLRAQIASASNRGSDAPPLLLSAAQQFESLDARLARDTYLDALAAALFAGRLASSGGAVHDVAAAVRDAPPAPPPRSPSDLILDGFITLIGEGIAAAAPLLKRGVSGYRSTHISGPEELRWLTMACFAAVLTWDYESWEALSARQVELSRNVGAFMPLPVALSTRAGAHLFAGEIGRAASLAAEVSSAAEAMQASIPPYAAATVAVFQGHDTEAFELIETGTKDVHDRGEGAGLTFLQWATAVLCNSLGRYGEALAAAQLANDDAPEQWFSIWGSVELIEAATRTGQAERASGAMQRLSDSAQASRTAWGLGIEARSQALLSDGETAEDLYRDAIEHLSGTRLLVELGRAHLLYGEWLRRQSRRLDARTQLRTAHEVFTTTGIDGFASRTAKELHATGETARKRQVGTASALTAQQAQIAQLVREGLSNPEIAARLYLSPRTIEWHLSKVYAKLHITSRHELPRESG